MRAGHSLSGHCSATRRASSANPTGIDKLFVSGFRETKPHVQRDLCKSRREVSTNPRLCVCVCVAGGGAGGGGGGGFVRQVGAVWPGLWGRPAEARAIRRPVRRPAERCAATWR